MNTFLTVKRVAEILNCKPSTIYAWAKEGKIPAFKLNGLLRFDPAQVEKWIKEKHLQPTDVNKPARKRTGRGQPMHGGKTYMSNDMNVDAIITHAIESITGSRYNANRENQTKLKGRKEVS